LKILRHEYKNALSSFVGYVLGACVFESSMFMMLLLNLCGTELAKLYQGVYNSWKSWNLKTLLEILEFTGPPGNFCVR